MAVNWDQLEQELDAASPPTKQEAPPSAMGASATSPSVQTRTPNKPSGVDWNQLEQELDASAQNQEQQKPTIQPIAPAPKQVYLGSKPDYNPVVPNPKPQSGVDWGALESELYSNKPDIKEPAKVQTPSQETRIATPSVPSQKISASTEPEPKQEKVFSTPRPPSVSPEQPVGYPQEIRPDATKTTSVEDVHRMANRVLTPDVMDVKKYPTQNDLDVAGLLADDALEVQGMVQSGSLQSSQADKTKPPIVIDVEGRFVVVPRVVDGKGLSVQEARDRYNKTGESFGVFDTLDNANQHVTDLQMGRKPIPRWLRSMGSRYDFTPYQQRKILDQGWTELDMRDLEERNPNEKAFRDQAQNIFGFKMPESLGADLLNDFAVGVVSIANFFEKIPFSAIPIMLSKQDLFKDEELKRLYQKAQDQVDAYWKSKEIDLPLVGKTNPAKAVLVDFPAFIINWTLMGGGGAGASTAGPELVAQEAPTVLSTGSHIVESAMRLGIASGNQAASEAASSGASPSAVAQAWGDATAWNTLFGLAFGMAIESKNIGQFIKNARDSRALRKIAKEMASEVQAFKAGTGSLSKIESLAFKGIKQSGLSGEEYDKLVRTIRERVKSIQDYAKANGLSEYEAWQKLRGEMQPKKIPSMLSEQAGQPPVPSAERAAGETKVRGMEVPGVGQETVKSSVPPEVRSAVKSGMEGVRNQLEAQGMSTEEVTKLVEDASAKAWSTEAQKAAASAAMQEAKDSIVESLVRNGKSLKEAKEIVSLEPTVAAESTRSAEKEITPTKAREEATAAATSVTKEPQVSTTPVTQASVPNKESAAQIFERVRQKEGSPKEWLEKHLQKQGKTLESLSGEPLAVAMRGYALQRGIGTMDFAKLRKSLNHLPTVEEIDLEAKRRLEISVGDEGTFDFGGGNVLPVVITDVRAGLGERSASYPKGKPTVEYEGIDLSSHRLFRFQIEIAGAFEKTKASSTVSEEPKSMKIEETPKPTETQPVQTSVSAGDPTEIERVKTEAEQAGARYNGMQKGPDGNPAFNWITLKEAGKETSVAVKPGESVASVIEEARQKFAPPEAPPEIPPEYQTPESPPIGEPRKVGSPQVERLRENLRQSRADIAKEKAARRIEAEDFRRRIDEARKKVSDVRLAWRQDVKVKREAKIRAIDAIREILQGYPELQGKMLTRGLAHINQANGWEKFQVRAEALLQKAEHLENVSRVKTVFEKARRYYPNMERRYQERLDRVFSDYQTSKPTPKTAQRLEGLDRFLTDNPDLAESVPEQVRDELVRLTQRPLVELSDAELGQLGSAVETIVHQAALKNSLVVRGQLRDAQETADAIVKEIVGSRKALREDYEEVGHHVRALRWLLKHGYRNVDTLSRSIGGSRGRITSLIEEVHRAWESRRSAIAEWTDYRNNAFESVGKPWGSRALKKWMNEKVVFVLPSGTFELTRGEATGLYGVLSRAEGAQRVAESGWGRESRPTESHRPMPMEEQAMFIEQVDPATRQLVDTLVRWLHRPEHVQALDDASFSVRGTHIKSEPDYFPVKRRYDIEAETSLPPKWRETPVVSLERQAFLQPLKPGADYTVLIGNGIETLERAVLGQESFIHLSEAIHNAAVVLGRSKPKEAMLSHLGKDGISVFEDFLRDVSGAAGGRKSWIENWVEKVEQTSIPAALMSPFSMARQGTQIFLYAGALDGEISFADIASAMKRVVQWKAKGKLRAKVDEMIRESPGARMVYENPLTLATPPLGAPAFSYGYHPVKDAMLWMTVKGDKFGRVGGWAVIESYLKRAYPELKEGSPEYKAKRAELFDRMNDERQPTDWPGARSGIAQAAKTRPLARAFTWFEFQSNMILNGVLRAGANYRRNPTSQNRKALITTVGGLVVANTILQALISRGSDVFYSGGQEKKNGSRWGLWGDVLEELAGNFYFLRPIVRSLRSRGELPLPPIGQWISRTAKGSAEAFLATEQLIKDERYKTGEQKGTKKADDTALRAANDLVRGLLPLMGLPTFPVSAGKSVYQFLKPKKKGAAINYEPPLPSEPVVPEPPEPAIP